MWDWDERGGGKDLLDLGFFQGLLDRKLEESGDIDVACHDDFWLEKEDLGIDRE